MLYYILAIVAVAFILKKVFIRSFPNKLPPGPKFKWPLLGQGDILQKYARSSYNELQRKYGDVVSLELTLGALTVIINDYELLKETLENPVFNNRYVIPKFMMPAMVHMKGGKGFHGIITTAGDEWKEQRRFALHRLKDLGFGKSSMEGAILEEALDMCEDIKNRMKANDEIKLDFKVNLGVLNVLLRVLVGTRYDLNDRTQLEILERINTLFEAFNLDHKIDLFVGSTVYSLFGYQTKFYAYLRREFQFIFSLGQKFYKEHEETYDEEHMRDFVDCYIRERRRANRENNKQSSFFGEHGHHSFNYVFFDLMMAGSETTSTTILWAVAFLINNPEKQRKAQIELDQVVGRSRHLSLADKEDLPYLNALIAEVQRLGNVVPFSIQHSNHVTATIGKYKVPPNTMIYPNLSAILMDPRNFDNPKEFRPERFIDPSTGRFKPHPALIPFGVGGRSCAGKTLAVIELFVFLGTFLQQFTFRPGSEGPPDLENYQMGVTRIPHPFPVKVDTRT